MVSRDKLIFFNNLQDWMIRLNIVDLLLQIKKYWLFIIQTKNHIDLITNEVPRELQSLMYCLTPGSWLQVYQILWTFFIFFSMFTQYTCNLKGEKVGIYFFFIYGSKKISNLFLIKFFDNFWPNPVAAKFIFLTKN